jgi:hypothetical protein
MFGNLLGLASGGRNEGNKDSHINLGPANMFHDKYTVADFTNHLQPQVAAVTITQGEQAGEGAQPALPQHHPVLDGGGNGGSWLWGNRSSGALDWPFFAMAT